MEYQGNIVEIPLGMDGLRTDDPDSKLSPGHLKQAINITMANGCLEKDFGSRRWNNTVLPAGVRCGIDYSPNDATQNLIALCKNGKVYKFADAFNYAEVGASGGAPSSLSISTFANIMECGAEQSLLPKKLFIFTGNSPVQVISGTNNTRTDISGPAAEWTNTNHPIYGVIHRGRVFAIAKDGSTAWASSALNHEDFSSHPLPYECYPGEGQRCGDLVVFRGKLFLLKFPTGLYTLNDDDPSADNWYFQKITGGIGAPNPLSGTALYDDYLLGNDYGSISSVVATNTLGDIKSSDIFAQSRTQNFVRENALVDGAGIRQALYYKDRKLALFIFRGKTSQNNNLIAQLDFSDQTKPRVFWNTKDQPNCLFNYRDITGVDRPFYGADDGYVYAMDQQDRWVGGATSSQTAYRGEFTTPAFDFGAGSPQSSKMLKNYDHLELIYIPTGDFKFYVDVYIDGRFSNTLEYVLKGGNELDVNNNLETIICDPQEEIAVMLPLKGSGRRIAFHCYNEGLGENFKIVSMKCYFRLAGQAQKKG